MPNYRDQYFSALCVESLWCMKCKKQVHPVSKLLYLFSLKISLLLFLIFITVMASRTSTHKYYSRYSGHRVLLVQEYYTGILNCTVACIYTCLLYTSDAADERSSVD